jgi:cytochrome c-type biogenesis protein
MNSVSIGSLSLALLGGLLTILSPCVLPILPLIISRSFKTHRLGPAMLVAGLICGFATIGSLLGIASFWFVGFANLLRGIAIAALILLGLLSIFPRLSYQIFSRWQLGTSWQPAQPRLWGEFWIGTQLGLLWTPCAGSALGSILVLAAVKHDILAALILLIFYGLGAGIPLLILAYTSRYLSQSWRWLLPHTAKLQPIGGILMTGTAISILLGWDVEIQLWLAPLFPKLPI